MDQPFFHTRFVALLIENDQRIRPLGLDGIKKIIYASSHFKNEGLWDNKLMSYIFEMHPPQIPHLCWITEKYYASKLRQYLPDQDQDHQTDMFDFFYTVGYARVISLRMRHNPNMGYTQDDLDFVMAALEKHYRHSYRDVRILEIGCGTGELLAALYARGYTHIEGIDISPSAIRLAKRRFRKDHSLTRNLHCLSLDDFCQLFPDNYYDIVIHADVIEHIAPYKTPDFLRTIHHLLKPKGYMIVMTPSKLTGPHDDTRLFESPGTEPQGFHLQEFSLDDLKTLLSEAGFGYFATVASLPSLNSYWDSISEENFRFKIDMEKRLLAKEWRVRKPIVDGMYFKGLLCRKIS